MWIGMAMIAFIAGQVYLFYCLRKLDHFLKRRPSDPPTFIYDDSCRYPGEDVIE